MEQKFKQIEAIVVCPCSSCSSFRPSGGTTMREINSVLFQGQRSIQNDGLALVLFCKVEAERQRHSGTSFMGYQ